MTKARSIVFIPRCIKKLYIVLMYEKDSGDTRVDKVYEYKMSAITRKKRLEDAMGNGYSIHVITKKAFMGGKVKRFIEE